MAIAQAPAALVVQDGEHMSTAPFQHRADSRIAAVRARGRAPALRHEPEQVVIRPGPAVPERHVRHPAAPRMVHAIVTAGGAEPNSVPAFTAARATQHSSGATGHTGAHGRTSEVHRRAIEVEREPLDRKSPSTTAGPGGEQPLSRGRRCRALRNGGSRGRCGPAGSG
ncbi:hypothetical protein GCM10025787_12870 [Saccharopolyspora rosea]